MHNVLFLSHEPTTAPGRAEFYELCLDPLNDEQEQVTHVREIHGWWDNETGRVVVDETQVEQAASFPTFGEALNVFVRRDGKIHHFYNTELVFLPGDRGQNQRHNDMAWPLWNLLDFTPEGRGMDWFPRLTYGK